MAQFDHIKHHKKRAFLEAYALTGTIAAACRCVGMSRQTYHHWRKVDEEFNETFVQAEDDHKDRLVEEATRRAIEGDPEPIINQGMPVYKRDPFTGEIETDENGKPVLYTKANKSDRLLELMLKARDPRFRDKSSVEVSGANGGPVEHSIEVTFVRSNGAGKPATEDDDDEDWMT